jgi:hypothetical protein
MSAALLRCPDGRYVKHRALGGDVRARHGIETAEIAAAAPAMHDGVEDVPGAATVLTGLCAVLGAARPTKSTAPI